MKQLVIFAALFLAVASTEVDHENWRKFKSEVNQQGRLGIEPREACNEPFKHGIHFDCDLTSPSQVPTSVHKLSPRDVKVVGAIGDSITAANGAYACTIQEVFIEYRGASWSIGGDDNLTLALTLPNILLLYNPDLIGYSLGEGNVNSNASNFNCAVPGSVASDMFEQAENLVNRIYAHPDVDVENDWKLITLFVGGNDLCDHCKNPSNFTKVEYKEQIAVALDYFHEKLPRTFVNVVGLINMTQLVRQKKFICRVVHAIICNCIVNLEQDELLELEQLNRGYQDAMRELAGSGKYDTRDDFTVVYQPFMEGTEFPLGEDGKVDQSYMAPDCFHLSAKGHAFAARELWTNMLQPVGLKSSSWDPFAFKIPCPTEETPYFATIRNSNRDVTTEQVHLQTPSGTRGSGVTPPDHVTTKPLGGAPKVSPHYLMALMTLTTAWFVSL